MAEPYSPNLRLVDLTEVARTKLGEEALRHYAAATGRPFDEPDWRFVVDTPSGGEITFNSAATASYVAVQVAELEQRAEAKRVREQNRRNRAR